LGKRHRPAAELDPLPLDPRDPDLVRAKELARRQSRTGEQPGLRPGLAAAFGFAIARLPDRRPGPSLLRGGRYVYGEPAGTAGPPGEGTATDSASPAFRR
jgi:hypothetical protein